MLSSLEAPRPSIPVIEERSHDTGTVDSITGCHDWGLQPISFPGVFLVTILELLGP